MHREASKPSHPELHELEFTGLRWSCVKHKSSRLSCWNRAYAEVFLFSTIPRSKYVSVSEGRGRRGGMDSSVGLNFIPGNDGFKSTLLHLQVGVNITLPLRADGWVKKKEKKKKFIWNKLTILHKEEGTRSLLGHSRAPCRLSGCKVNKLCAAHSLPGEPANRWTASIRSTDK